MKVLIPETAGVVHILYGSSSGLQTSSPVDQFWNQNTPGVEDKAETGDEFGGASSADFNGDGKTDLAIGVPSERIGTTIFGVVHVLYGSSSGVQTTSPADQLWHIDSPGVNGAEGTFGYTFSNKYQGQG